MSSSRDTRIDVARGTALLLMSSGHVIGNPVLAWLPVGMGLSDMAEVFVFLSGYLNSLGQYGRVAANTGAWASLKKVLYRCGHTLWWYHLSPCVDIRSGLRHVRRISTPSMARLVFAARERGGCMGDYDASVHVIYRKRDRLLYPNDDARPSNRISCFASAGCHPIRCIVFLPEFSVVSGPSEAALTLGGISLFQSVCVAAVVRCRDVLRF